MYNYVHLTHVYLCTCGLNEPHTVCATITRGQFLHILLVTGPLGIVPAPLVNEDLQTLQLAPSDTVM